MITWTMIAVLCSLNGPCQTSVVGEFKSEAACIEATDMALVKMHRDYNKIWAERGVIPAPPAQAGVGCRKDEPV